jgi:hypothetical protein
VPILFLFICEKKNKLISTHFCKLMQNIQLTGQLIFLKKLYLDESENSHEQEFSKQECASHIKVLWSERDLKKFLCK